MRWRWDQGRLGYFQYANLVLTAKVLSGLVGTVINPRDGTDPLRQPLERYTGLPFSPAHYKVWRNYARVFQCAMLATSINGRLFVTDICKLLLLPPSEFSSDQYFNLLFSRFSYPFAPFEDYNVTHAQVFPFLAIMKLAMSRGKQGVSLEDVFAYVVGNNCTGLEDVGNYGRLPRSRRVPIGDERRQVREMMCIMGQATYMKWFSGRLYVDAINCQSILNSIVPFIRIKRCQNPAEEFCHVTCIDRQLDLGTLDVGADFAFDHFPVDFAASEGGRTFKTHGRIERSPMVRRMYFRVHPRLICDACRMDTRHKYPWIGNRNILELHHVLPLSATLNVNGTTTRLDDLVPLCPSCHKSVHIFYKVELDRLGIDDFNSKGMAHEVYNRAKERITA